MNIIQKCTPIKKEPNQALDRKPSKQAHEDSIPSHFEHETG